MRRNELVTRAITALFTNAVLFAGLFDAFITPRARSPVRCLERRPHHCSPHRRRLERRSVRRSERNETSLSDTPPARKKTRCPTGADRSLSCLARTVLWGVRFPGYGHRKIITGNISRAPYLKGRTLPGMVRLLGQTGQMIDRFFW